MSWASLCDFTLCFAQTHDIKVSTSTICGINLKWRFSGENGGDFPKKERISKDTQVKDFWKRQGEQNTRELQKRFPKKQGFLETPSYRFFKETENKIHKRTIKRILVEGGVNYFQCFLLNPFFVYLSFSLQCVKETN